MGTYAPGEKLPSERDIAESKKVSRVSVRDAVNRLSQMGLIKKVPQSGTYVSDYLSEATMELLIEILKSGTQTDPGLLFSLLEFRRLVESFAVKKGAVNASKRVLTKLKRLVQEQEEHIEDARKLTQIDFNIHLTLVTLSENMVIQVLFNNFKQIYHFYTQIFYEMEGAAPEAVNYHRQLVGAIENKDGDYAHYIMEQHLLYGENRMKEAMEIYAGDES